METSNEVKYDGEYVLTKSGSKDFGEILQDSVIAIGGQAGKIRLRIGEHDETTGKGYGEIHIERSDRMAQLKQNGFQNARDFVQDIAKKYDEMYQGGNGALLLVKRDMRNDVIVVHLEPLEDGFYDVKTAYVSRRDFFKNKKPLWQKAQSGSSLDAEGRSPTSIKPPSADADIQGI
jgi:hypothetical protein